MRGAAQGVLRPLRTSPGSHAGSVYLGVSFRLEVSPLASYTIIYKDTLPESELANM